MPKKLCKGIHSKTLDTAEQNCKKKKKNSNDNQEGRQKKKSQKLKKQTEKTNSK